MAERKSRIHLGNSYYFPHHEAKDWPRDLARMAEAGFNAMRTAELLASWDRIEREPRKPDFAWLDRSFDLAAENGMKILLGTGSCCPPIWMVDEYPDLQVVSRDGHPYPTGGTWSWACHNHPGYLQESDRYLGQLIERYAKHPALMAWQIQNEPGYPFIPRPNQPMDWYDYNPHTVAKFRVWLRAKYGDIEALNDAWRWDPTHHQYKEWSQIQAPRVLPIEWGVIGAWLDWRTFCNDNWTWFIAHQAEFIRARDPHHPTTTNLAGEANDWTGRLGVDGWKIAPVVDAMGYDLYPGLKKRGNPERGRLPGGPTHVSWFLDFGRSVSLHAGKTFWLPEMESGPLDGWIKGPRYTTGPLDLKRWILECLGHGAKMILYQGYREWNCIPIHWGALVDLHGDPTPRYHMAAALNALVHEHADVLDDAMPARTEVGILYNHANTLLCGSLGADDFNRPATLGVHESLWTAHVPVEFIAPPYTADIPYRVLFMPFAMMVSAELAEQLRAYVEGGGTLVAFAKCGFVDERGWYWNTRPGGGLDRVFGVRETNLFYEPDPFTVSLRLAGGTIEVPGHHHRQIVEPGPDAEVLGTFAGGEPALVRNRYGKGTAYYCATHLDVASFRSARHHAAFRALLREIGIEPPVRVTGTNADHVDPHLLGGARDRMLFVVNEAAEDAHVEIELRGVAAQDAREHFGLAFEVLRKDPFTIGVRIPAQDAAAFRIRG
jgi:beta-galactosidase GanA